MSSTKMQKQQSKGRYNMRGMFDTKINKQPYVGSTYSQCNHKRTMK